MTFAHKTGILNGFGAETFFSKLCRFFSFVQNSLGFRFLIGFVEVAGVEQKLNGILGKH